MKNFIEVRSAHVERYCFNVSHITLVQEDSEGNVAIYANKTWFPVREKYKTVLDKIERAQKER